MQVTKNYSYEFWKMVEYGRVPKKGFGRVSENGRICASTEKMLKSRRVPEFMGVSKNCPCKYQKRVEPGPVPEKCSIRAVPKKGSGEYWKMVESGRVPGKR